MRSIVKIYSRNAEITLLLIYVYYALVANFSVANMSFNAIRENKILAKISGFTVVVNKISHGAVTSRSHTLWDRGLKM